jgi:hypothetical protein
MIIFSLKFVDVLKPFERKEILFNLLLIEKGLKNEFIIWISYLKQDDIVLIKL